MYIYADRINDPTKELVHQLLCNSVRLTPYFEELIRLAKEKGWYQSDPAYFIPIEAAVEEVKKEQGNGSVGE